PRMWIAQVVAQPVPVGWKPDRSVQRDPSPDWTAGPTARGPGSGAPIPVPARRQQIPAGGSVATEFPQPMHLGHPDYYLLAGVRPTGLQVSVRRSGTGFSGQA